MLQRALSLTSTYLTACCLLCRCRDLLTAYLVNEAQEQFPGKINFHFETQLDSLSLEGKTATFTSVADGQTHTLPFDIVIGADGANSRCGTACAAVGLLVECGAQWPQQQQHAESVCAQCSQLPHA